MYIEILLDARANERHALNYIPIHPNTMSYNIAGRTRNNQFYYGTQKLYCTNK